MEAASSPVDSAEATSITALWREWGRDVQGIFGQNSDGEFAVGQNTRKTPTSSFTSTSGSPFLAGDNPGKLLEQLFLSERRAPLLSACVLEGNIQQHTFTWTGI